MRLVELQAFIGYWCNCYCDVVLPFRLLSQLWSGSKKQRGPRLKRGPVFNQHANQFRPVLKVGLLQHVQHAQHAG